MVVVDSQLDTPWVAALAEADHTSAAVDSPSEAGHNPSAAERMVARDIPFTAAGSP